MDLFQLLIIAVVVIFIIAVILFQFTTSSASVMIHTITLGKIVIYSGAALSVVTSDRIANVVYSSTTGISQYNVTTGTTTLLNPTVATGLAYDGQNYLVLQQGGLVSRLNLNGTNSTLTPLWTGFTALYDTTDSSGYFVSVGGITAGTGATGSVTPANGNYGPIQLKIT
jgi:hypothetical protein